MKITIEEDSREPYVIEDVIAWKIWVEEDVAVRAYEIGEELSDEEIGRACDLARSGLEDCTDSDWQHIDDAIIEVAERRNKS